VRACVCPASGGVALRTSTGVSCVSRVSAILRAARRCWDDIRPSDDDDDDASDHREELRAASLLVTHVQCPACPTCRALAQPTSMLAHSPGSRRIRGSRRLAADHSPGSRRIRSSRAAPPRRARRTAPWRPAATAPPRSRPRPARPPAAPAASATAACSRCPPRAAAAPARAPAPRPPDVGTVTWPAPKRVGRDRGAMRVR
jgi:hypothetical protein